MLSERIQSLHTLLILQSTLQIINSLDFPFSNKHKLRLFTIHMGIRIRKHNLQVVLHLLQHCDHLFQRFFLIF